MSNTEERCDLSSSRDCPERREHLLQRVTARAAEIGGGITVSRLMPSRQRRMIGAWCFLDHAGPAEFEPGGGLGRGPAPAHRPADLYLDDPGRGVAPRQPGQRPGDPPRPGQPDDRRPWHRPHRGVTARRAPRPRRAVVDRAALRAARHRPGLRPSSRPAALAGAGGHLHPAGRRSGRAAGAVPALLAAARCRPGLPRRLDPATGASTRTSSTACCRWKAGWKWAASISR